MLPCAYEIYISTRFSQVLRSLYFLPVQARVDFYFKVILPSVTWNGMLVWGLCGAVLFSGLEKIHVRAAKLIYDLRLAYPLR